MQRIIAFTIERHQSTIETMERCANRLKNRPDYSDVIAKIKVVRDRFDALVKSLETKGMILEDLQAVLSSLGQEIDSTRLQIRKMTGIKRFAAVRM